MHSRILLILPLFVLSVFPAPSQTPGAFSPGVIATVGGETIGAAEFAARYALTVFPYKDAQRRGNAVKYQFLYSLVAERLLAAEARRRGIDREEYFSASLRQAERRFVRDRLYRERVRAAVVVTPADIASRMRERRRRVEYQFLFSVSQEEIDNCRRLLKDGIPFDTLLAARQLQDPAAASDIGPDTEELEPELAAAIRSLAPGEVSVPLRTPAGWYLLRRVLPQRAGSSPMDDERERMAAERELRGERETEATVAYVKSLWKGRRAQLNDSAYRRIGQALLEDARRSERSGGGEVLGFGAFVFDTLRARFGKGLLQPFATIGERSYSVEQFLDDLQDAAFRFQKRDIRRFPALLRNVVENQLDRFLITEEGYRLQLQFDSAVRADMAVWTGSGLAQALPDALWEQFLASDDSVLAFIAAHPQYAASLPDPRIVRLLGGDTARPPDAGSIDTARPRDAGSIDTARPYVMQLLREELERSARGMILARKIHDLVVAAARSTPVAVNDEALRAFEPDPGTMYTIRFLGFGGRMPAMPGVMPLFDAVLEGLETKAGITP